MPITWQNINAPNFSGVSEALSRAQSGMSSAFNDIGNIFTKQQAIAQDTWDQGKTDNLAAFRNKLLGYATPEDFKQAQTSGELQQYLSGFGDQVDKTKAQEFMETMPGVLRDRVIQEQNYKEQQDRLAAAPIIDRLKVLSLSQDPDAQQSARDALEAYVASGHIKNGADLVNTFNTDETNRRDSAWKETQKALQLAKVNRDIESHESNLKTNAISRANMAKQGKLTDAQLKKLNDADLVDTIIGRANIMSVGKEITDGMPTPKLYENAVLNLIKELGEDKVPASVAAAVVDKARALDTGAFSRFEAEAKKTGYIGPESINGGAEISKVLTDTLATVKGLDPDDEEIIRHAVGELITDGVEINIGGQKTRVYPTGNIIRQVVPIAEGNTGWNFNIGTDVKDKIKKIMQSPEFAQQYVARLSSDARKKFVNSVLPTDTNKKPRFQGNN